MRALGLVLVTACGVGSTPAPDEPQTRGVRRTVEVELTVQEGRSGRGAERVEARAWIRPGAVASPTRGTECEWETAPAPGVAAASGLTLDLGRKLDLRWDPAAGAYTTREGGDGLDPSWRPVLLQTPQDARVQLELDEALQFGDRLWIEDVERMPDGGQRVSWRGEHPPESVFLRVRSAAGRLRCESHDGFAILPWWAAELPGATLTLAATRESRSLGPDGTLVIGRATLEVPLVVHAENRDGLAAEEAEPSAGRQPNRVGVGRATLRRLGHRPKTSGRG